MYSQSHIKLKTIAIFSDNKALSSLLHAILEKNIHLRVREFASEIALKQYININSIDLLIYDCEQIDEKAIFSIQNIKETETPANTKFQTIALCKSIPRGIRSICKSIGIDELIIKPMSPSYLEARVKGRMSENSANYPTAYLRKSTLKYANLDIEKNRRKNDKKFSAKHNSTNQHQEITNNIIPLFGNRDKPTPPAPTKES